MLYELFVHRSKDEASPLVYNPDINSSSCKCIWRKKSSGTRSDDENVGTSFPDQRCRHVDNKEEKNEKSRLGSFYIF